MAELYRTKVQQLAAALVREDARAEAFETLRELIDAIVLMPEKGQLRIELRGNLAAMLTAAQKTAQFVADITSQPSFKHSDISPRDGINMCPVGALRAPCV